MPTAIVTWQALQRSSASTTRAKRPLGRADNQQRALDVVADLVRDRAQKEATGARHALVADNQQVVVPLFGDLHEGGGRVAVVDASVDLHARVGVAGSLPVDDLLGLLADAGGQDRQHGARSLPQLARTVHSLGCRGRPIRADEDALVHRRRRYSCYIPSCTDSSRLNVS